MINRLTALKWKVCNYMFNLKYQQVKKMFVSNASSRIHIEAENVLDIIPLTFFHFSIEHMYHSYQPLAHNIYRHKVKYPANNSVKLAKIKKQPRIVTSKKKQTYKQI